MDSPIARATGQAAVLSVLSNVIGQCISCYQDGRPLSFDTTQLVHFMLFSIMACPPNFLWQMWLENAFPGYGEKPSTENRELRGEKDQPSSTGVASNDTAHKRKDGQVTPQAPASTPPDKKTLNYRNTAIKFALDQTLGAAANTVMFIAGIALLRGENMETVIHKVSEEFFSLLSAGQKLWPLVSIISFTLIPVESRTVFGSIVGVGWGIFLSVSSGGKK